MEWIMRLTILIIAIVAISKRQGMLQKSTKPKMDALEQLVDSEAEYDAQTADEIMNRQLPIEKDFYPGNISTEIKPIDLSEIVREEK